MQCFMKGLRVLSGLNIAIATIFIVMDYVMDNPFSEGSWLGSICTIFVGYAFFGMMVFHLILQNKMEGDLYNELNERSLKSTIMYIMAIMLILYKTLWETRFYPETLPSDRAYMMFDAFSIVANIYAFNIADNYCNMKK